MSNEFKLGAGLTLRRTRKPGFSGYWEDHRYKINQGQTLARALPETQGRILESILRRGACTPSELADAVGITSPSVLYQLGHLIEMGIVDRVDLPGGRVLYVSNWEITPQLSPQLQKRVEDVAKKRDGIGGLAKLTIKDVRREFADLKSDEVKEVIHYLTYVVDSQ